MFIINSFLIQFMGSTYISKTNVMCSCFLTSVLSNVQHMTCIDGYSLYVSNSTNFGCWLWDKLLYWDVYPIFILYVLQQKLQCYESNYNIENKFTKFIYTIYMKLNKITTMRTICSKSCKIIVHFVITIIRTRLQTIRLNITTLTTNMLSHL